MIASISLAVGFWGSVGPGAASSHAQSDTAHYAFTSGARGSEPGSVSVTAGTTSFSFGAAGDYGDTPRVTAVLQAMARAHLPALNSDGSIFQNNLDAQATGNLAVHQSPNQFTLVGTDCYGADGSPCNPLTVENQVVDSPPNAVGIDVSGGGSGFLGAQYDGSGYPSHTLGFHVRLGDDFALAPNQYLVLANTTPDGASLILTASGNLFLDYADSGGSHHYIYTSGILTSGAWHSIVLGGTMGSQSSGALSLTVDGLVVASSSNIGLGTEPVVGFSVGNEYTPPDPSTRGHIYIDDVRSTPAGPSAPASTPTPTALPASTPTFTPSQTPTPSLTSTPTPTSTGGALFVNAFDQQMPGALKTGSGPSDFSGDVGAGQLSIGNAVYSSAPQSLAVASSGGGSAYAYRSRDTGLRSLQFSIQLGTDFLLPSGEFMVLAQTAPSAARGNGSVSLILSGGSLFLDYRDSGGNQRYVWSDATLSPGSWHTIRIDETLGEGTGMLALSEDGIQQGAASGLSLGTLPIQYLAVGMEYSPTDPGTAGHFYVDDVTVRVRPVRAPHTVACWAPRPDSTPANLCIHPSGSICRHSRHSV